MSYTAQDSFTEQAKPKCLEKEHLKSDLEGANHTLKLSFASGIIFQVKVNKKSRMTLNTFYLNPRIQLLCIRGDSLVPI